MADVRFKVAPDVEFYIQMSVAGIDQESRDYDVQQHKEELFREFESRLAQCFPEGFKIDDFHFGLDRN